MSFHGVVTESYHRIAGSVPSPWEEVWLPGEEVLLPWEEVWLPGEEVWLPPCVAKYSGFAKNRRRVIVVAASSSRESYSHP